MDTIQNPKPLPTPDQQALRQVVALSKRLQRELVLLQIGRVVDKAVTGKVLGLLLGSLYVVGLYALVLMGYRAGNPFFTGGFAAMALLMSVFVGTYLYQIYLLKEIGASTSAPELREKLAWLRAAVVYSVRLAVLQIPLWFICWLDAATLMRQPLLFAGAAYGTFWLYRRLDEQQPASSIMAFFFSGPEWRSLRQLPPLVARLAADNGAFRAERAVESSAGRNSAPAPARLYNTLV